MNKQNLVKTNIFKILVMASALTIASTNSLAELNQKTEVYTQKGYPYEDLVNRTEAVTIFYTESLDNISCRVEVSHNGQIWRGEERSTSLKTFTQKPLRACLKRVDAKNLLANTF